MLRNALDGSEDPMARGDAHRCWKELRMLEKRAAAIADVSRLHAITMYEALTMYACGRAAHWPKRDTTAGTDDNTNALLLLWQLAPMHTHPLAPASGQPCQAPTQR